MIPGDGRRLDLSPIRAVKLQTDGSSWRVVVDVGEWDDSHFIGHCTADERSAPLRKDGSCSSQQDTKRAPRSLLKQEANERC